MSFCSVCFHPCHCGEEKKIHSEEYGVCTCNGCECKNNSVDKTYENEVEKK